MSYTLRSCDRTGLDYIDFDGHRRILGSIPSGGKMKASLPNYAAAGNPMYDKKDYIEVSRRAICPWIFDQNGHGSCVGNGWAGGLTRARVLAGCKPVVLSPAWVYSLINGNQDQGAVISDGTAALTQVGACTFATVGQDPIYQSRMPAGAKVEAARYKLKSAYHCDTWQEVLSAVMSGRFIPVYGYMVGNNFMHADQYGVAGHDRGPGNHCNHADGVKRLPDGRWVLDNVNSWNTSFMDGGRCYIDEDHLFGGGDQADVCVIEAFAEDPQEPNDPPAYQA